MIEQVLERARARGASADALLRDQATLSLKFESGRLKESAMSQEAGLNLRVFASGRVGTAGTTDLDQLVMFVVDATRPFSKPAKLE